MNREEPASIVRIHHVAKAAGVSITTVSQALSGKGRISEETRRRVQLIARELRYRANPLAQGLARGDQGVLGLLISSPDGDQDMLGAGVGYFVDLVNNAAGEAAYWGYWLALAPPIDLANTADKLRIDGAVVVDPITRDGSVERLISEHIPFVTTGRPPDRDDVPYWVDNDHKTATVQILDHLRSGGATRIGLISAPPIYSYIIDALYTYDTWCQSHDLEPRVEVVDSAQKAIEAATRLIEDAHSNAIYATLDRLGIGVLRAAHDLGVKVPDDLQVACLTDTHDARMASPPLTTVNLRPDEIGHVAIDMLVSVIRGKAPKSDHRVIPTQIISRESTIAT